jgi:hypothetical protein
MNADQRYAVRREIDRRARLRPTFRNTETYRGGRYFVFSSFERPRVRRSNGKYKEGVV